MSIAPSRMRLVVIQCNKYYLPNELKILRLHTISQVYLSLPAYIISIRRDDMMNIQKRTKVNLSSKVFGLVILIIELKISTCVYSEFN